MTSSPKRRRSAKAKPSANGVRVVPNYTVAEPDYPAAAPPPPLVTASGQVLTRLCDLERAELKSLWPGYLPCGVVTVVTGPQGSGKTALLGAAAAHLTGKEVFPSSPPIQGGSVLWYTVEDDPRSMLLPRLAAAGVRVERVHVPDYEPSGRMRRRSCLPIDAQAIGDLAFEVGASTVIFDPLSSFLAAGMSPNDPLQVRAVMESLAVMAAEHGLCVIGTLHPRKGRLGTPLEWVSGSAAWTQSARQVLLLDRHPDEHDQFLLSVLKRCTSSPCPSWQYELNMDTGYPVFGLTRQTTIRPEELAELGDLGELLERADALEWLRQELVEERETGALYRRWQGQGYGQRLWWRCRRKLGVKVRRVGSQREQTTFLYLPPSSPPPP
jgi:AAA domain